MIKLLAEHGAKLNDSESATFCTNHTVESIRLMLKDYNDRCPGCHAHNMFLNKVKQITRFSVTGGCAILAALIAPQFFSKITPSFTTMAISGATTATAFLCSWFILPQFAYWISGKYSGIKRNRIQQSLFSTIDRLRDSNPDMVDKNALRWLLSCRDQESNVAFQNELAARLGLNTN